MAPVTDRIGTSARLCHTPFPRASDLAAVLTPWPCYLVHNPRIGLLSTAKLSALEAAQLLRTSGVETGERGARRFGGSAERPKNTRRGLPFGGKGRARRSACGATCGRTAPRRRSATVPRISSAPTRSSSVAAAGALAHRVVAPFNPDARVVTRFENPSRRRSRSPRGLGGDERTKDFPDAPTSPVRQSESP
jgi:hypothetical protein